ncbi:MAG TPA: manganese efflux pump MntP family protein [Mycobacteriales bacterium]|nr:manganese efflux pump MntP family protein [Mycobacteriales bacterium]
MSSLTLVLIAFGVSADAFAVAVGKGLQMRRLDLRTAATIALAFGVFQAGMPVVGWLLGSQLERVVTTYDHWLAFALLVGVGGKMLHEAVAGSGAPGSAALSWRQLLVLSVATSIDALAVGISFAFLPVSIVPAVLLIGAVTLAVSFAGVLLGHRAGARWRGPAEVAGGLVLILIGFRILFDHLGLL